MNRRGFLQSILAAGVAPAFVGAAVLMPVKKLWTPRPIITFDPALPGGRSAYLISWTVTNSGSADLTVKGISWQELYADAGDVVLRPNENLTFDTATRTYSRKFG